MATMTVQEMRDYVRTYLDVDEEELPDTLLDAWRFEATARIAKAFEPWDFLQDTWSLTTTTQVVPFSSIIDGTTPESIVQVEGDTYVLRYIPHEVATRKYAFGSGASGRPIEWSVWSDELYFWPDPAGTSYDYTIRGYRDPTQATLAGDEVDLPGEFHFLIVEWMLARQYERDDDEIMSTQKFNRFEQQIEILHRRYTRPPKAGVQAIGQFCTTDTIGDMPSRLWYDWE